jgi:hypothetical protein
MEAEASEERAIQALEERRSRIVDPVRLEKELDEIKERVGKLQEKKNNLTRLADCLRDEIARNQRQIASKALSNCEEILESVQAIADRELLHAVAPLLAAESEIRIGCPFKELVPAQLEVLIRGSDVLKQTREALRKSFCDEAAESARLAEYRRELNALKARRKLLGDESDEQTEPGLLSRICRELVEYHGVPKELLQKILTLHDAQKLVRELLEPALADAEIEQTWSISSNVLSEVISELGGS